MTLPVGVHELRAHREGYAPKTFSVKVLRGRNSGAVRLERLHGTLALDVQPASAMVEVSYEQGSDRSTVAYESAALRIPTGPVEITASAVGYRNYRQRLTLPAKTLSHAVRLVRFDVTPRRAIPRPAGLWRRRAAAECRSRRHLPHGLARRPRRRAARCAR